MPLIETKTNTYTNGIAVLVFSVLIAAASAFFLLRPAYQIRSANTQVLEEKKVESGKIKSLNIQAKQSFAELEKNKDSLNRFDLALPAAANVPDIYAHLESLILAANMTIASMNAQDPEPSSTSAPGTVAPVSPVVDSSVGALVPSFPSLKVLPINLTVRGDYNSLNSFLGSLEKSLFLLDVQSVDVVADKSSDFLQFKLEINSYYYDKR
jgi:Tfp pilus assembly protein PilO